MFLVEKFLVEKSMVVKVMAEKSGFEMSCNLFRLNSWVFKPSNVAHLCIKSLIFLSSGWFLPIMAKKSPLLPFFSMLFLASGTKVSQRSGILWEPGSAS